MNFSTLLTVKINKKNFLKLRINLIVKWESTNISPLKITEIIFTFFISIISPQKSYKRILIKKYNMKNSSIYFMYWSMLNIENSFIKLPFSVFLSISLFLSLYLIICRRLWWMNYIEYDFYRLSMKNLHFNGIFITQ